VLTQTRRKRKREREGERDSLVDKGGGTGPDKEDGKRDNESMTDKGQQMVSHSFKENPYGSHSAENSS
jgi:hypothetical protein